MERAQEALGIELQKLPQHESSVYHMCNSASWLALGCATLSFDLVNSQSAAGLACSQWVLQQTAPSSQHGGQHKGDGGWRHIVIMQVLGLGTTEHAEASSDDEAADDQSDAASSAEDDADIDDLEDESDAASSAAGSDEEVDEDEDPVKPSSSAGLAKTRVKKQKTGDAASGLGSVGWEASDEEEEGPAAVLASGMVLQLYLQIK